MSQTATVLEDWLTRGLGHWQPRGAAPAGPLEKRPCPCPPGAKGITPQTQAIQFSTYTVLTGQQESHYVPLTHGVHQSHLRQKHMLSLLTPY